MKNDDNANAFERDNEPLIKQLDEQGGSKAKVLDIRKQPFINKLPEENSTPFYKKILCCLKRNENNSASQNENDKNCYIPK